MAHESKSIYLVGTALINLLIANKCMDFAIKCISSFITPIHWIYSQSCIQSAPFQLLVEHSGQVLLQRHTHHMPNQLTNNIRILSGTYLHVYTRIESSNVDVKCLERQKYRVVVGFEPRPQWLALTVHTNIPWQIYCCSLILTSFVIHKIITVIIIIINYIITCITLCRACLCAVRKEGLGVGTVQVQDVIEIIQTGRFLKQIWSVPLS